MFEGLNLFRVRNLSERLPENEKILNLPPIYKVFIESFFVARGGMLSQKYLDPKFNEKLEFLEQYYAPDEGRLLIYDFFSPEEALEAMKNAYSADDGIHKLNVFPIGECSSDQILFVGTGPDNLDNIILESSGSENRFTFKAKNIFEFVRGIQMRSSNDVNSISINRFYKNWDEDFWRVRE